MLFIAIGFISLGLWLVVPFLGFELVIITTVFYVVSCNAKRIETIEISNINRWSVKPGRYKHLS